MPLLSTNPATGQLVRSYEEHDAEAVNFRLDLAREAFFRHRHALHAERSAGMHAVAGALEQSRDSLARRITDEMGKPISASLAEIDKCVRACRHYAAQAEAYLEDEPIASDAHESFVRYLPMGVILGIMPWNFPFWQVFRFAVPAIMAGNVVLLKHASNVTGCALAIESTFAQGFSEGVFQALLVSSPRVQAILEDPRVAAVSLTGSDGAGASVAAVAGARLKKCVLELGGSDPFIVMPSADLEAAIKAAVTAKMVNGGQSCIAAKRFIVHDSCYERFASGLMAGFEALRLGNPSWADTELGPLATGEGLALLEGQVQALVEAGAVVRCGGKRGPGPGYYYAPTILERVPRVAVAREELFGPVALLYRATDIAEAIHIANETPFGLGSSVWTALPSEQERFVDELEAGMTFVNAVVASDSRLPFGGVKRSGFGRELGRHGILEFANAKTVYFRAKNEEGPPAAD